MTRALLAFALALSLGSSAAQPWAEALLRLTLALPNAGEIVNSTQPPNGGDINGTDPDAGSKWDPNG